MKEDATVRIANRTKGKEEVLHKMGRSGPGCHLWKIRLVSAFMVILKVVVLVTLHSVPL